MYSTLLYYNYNSNTENIKHYKFTIWQNHSTNTKSWKLGSFSAIQYVLSINRHFMSLLCSC